MTRTMTPEQTLSLYRLALQVLTKQAGGHLHIANMAQDAASGVLMHKANPDGSFDFVFKEESGTA